MKVVIMFFMHPERIVAESCPYSITIMSVIVKFQVFSL